VSRRYSPEISGTHRDMESAAVLLDVDGTLVDTTYLHALAWFRALRLAGRPHEMAEIHRLIGMGSDKLLEALVGEERKELVEAWEHEFDRLKRDIVVIPGARDLIVSLHDHGVHVVLATSGKPRDVRQIRELLGADDLIDAAVNSEEVESSKPAPDIFRLALERVHAPATRAMVVGDTVWDLRAARAIDVPAVAVLTGGIAEAELRAEGAADVYHDVAALAENLDTSPLASLWA
jgi:HAD superfamily hydrolase (TIGR01509 family)